MALLSTELVNYLNAEDEHSLKKRLRLAENIFTSPDLIVSRKEDIILDWLCKTIDKNENEKCAWETLKNCIDYQNHHKLSVNLKAPIKNALICTLSGSLENTEQHNEEFILHCCRSILDSSEMQKSYITNPEMYIQLLGKLLTHEIPKENNDNQQQQLLSIITDAIEKLIKYYRHYPDKNKIAEIFVDHLLNRLCIFGEKTSCPKLNTTILKCIGKIIFDKFNSETESSETMFESVFLSKKNNDDEGIIVISSYIFQSSIMHYKNLTSSVDFVYRKLLDSTKNLAVKIEVCANLNKYLSNITLDMKNEIDGISLLTYQENIIIEILSMDHMTYVTYDCLGSTARFNPLVIEGKLPDILKKILLAEKLESREDISYSSLMSDIFDACVRLRRENKLVSWILMSLSQALTENNGKLKHFNEETCSFLPTKFIEKFTLSIRNMTNKQIIGVLMTFTHHLNSLLQSKITPIAYLITINITSQLCIGFFKGIPIASQTWSSTDQQKFINNLVDLGKTLAMLAQQQITGFDREKFYEKIVMHFMSITQTWETLIGLFKHYAAESMPQNVVLSVLEIIQAISASIKKSDSDKVKSLALLCKLEESRIKRKNSNSLQTVMVKKMKKFEHNKYWETIIKHYPCVISHHINPSQMKSLADYIVKTTDAKLLDGSLDNDHLLFFEKIVSSHSVGNNEDLITAIILAILEEISSKFDRDSLSVTKALLNETNIIIWEDPERLTKKLTSFKNILNQPQWVKIVNSDSLNHFERYLNTLLLLPLIHCSNQLKTMIFLIIFSLKQECPADGQVLNICNKILLDTTESCNFDILQYISLNIIIKDLSKESMLFITRVLEFSFTNASNYAALASLIKTKQENNKLETVSQTVLIECLEKIKPKIKSVDDKTFIKKQEEKLQKKIQRNLEAADKNSVELKNLTVLIKFTVSAEKNKIEDSLLEIIHSALDSRIGENQTKNSDVLNELLQFIKVVFKHRANGIKLDDTRIKNIWSLMLKKSSEDIISLLIESTDPKILGIILNLLRKQTIDAITKKTNNDDQEQLENSLAIWSCIAKADMGANRAKIRQIHLHALIQALETSSSISFDLNSRTKILKLFSLISSSKRMHINEKTIDLILLLTNHLLSIDEAVTINVCQQALQLCSTLLKVRSGMSADRLANLLYLYKKIIKFTVIESKKDGNNQQEITVIALEIQKVTSILIKLKKDLARLSPYLIADLIQIYSDGVIPFYVKEPLDESVGLLLSICDQHAISFLNRVLPESMQEIFKTLYENYNKFSKFTGKI